MHTLVVTESGTGAQAPAQTRVSAVTMAAQITARFGFGIFIAWLRVYNILCKR